MTTTPDPGYHFYANPSEDEEGGFCDTRSHIHYTQESNEETHNHAAVVEEFGGSSFVRGNGDDDTYNTTTLELDDLGYEYPARYEPGK
jgi:hypothetical protein